MSIMAQAVSDEGRTVPLRLLVIDDEPITVKLMVLVFEGEGFTVISAGNGEEGLTKMDACDVVLLDLMMPGMDGMEVLRRVRADDALEGLPVVMFTARSDGVTALLAKAAGVTGFHVKPPDLDHLIVDVRRLAEARAAERRVGAGSAASLGPVTG